MNSNYTTLPATATESKLQMSLVPIGTHNRIIQIMDTPEQKQGLNFAQWFCEKRCNEMIIRLVGGLCECGGRKWGGLSPLVCLHIFTQNHR